VVERSSDAVDSRRHLLALHTTLAYKVYKPPPMISIKQFNGDHALTDFTL